MGIVEEGLRLIFFGAGYAVSAIGFWPAFIVFAPIPAYAGVYAIRRQKHKWTKNYRILVMTVAIAISFILGSIIFVSAIVLGRWG